MDNDTYINSLAVDLEQYAFDRDPYSYYDFVDSREEGLEMIGAQLERGEISGIREDILKDLEEMEGSEDPLRQTAKELIDRLNVLQSELESDNVTRCKEARIVCKKQV